MKILRTPAFAILFLSPALIAFAADLNGKWHGNPKLRMATIWRSASFSKWMVRN